MGSILLGGAPEEARAHQASCSAVTASLGLMAGQGMLLPAALEDRRREWALSPSAGTVMLGRFQPGTAAEASCTVTYCILRTWAAAQGQSYMKKSYVAPWVVLQIVLL